MVIWIIGLSGAGKTELGRALAAEIRKTRPNTVMLDGDMVREIMGSDIGYTVADRKKNADRICRMCKALEEQRINVVCAILSMFPESRAWNRKNLRSYFEVFIDVPMMVLIRRNQKGLYSAALEGKAKNVVGVDIPFERPDNPDYVFTNDRQGTPMQEIALEIIKKLPLLD